MKNICFIVNGYPTKDDPIYAFIRPIVLSIADLGYNCTVIAPQSITNAIKNKKKLRDYQWIDMSDNGRKIRIYQPKYVSLSNIRAINNNLSIILRDKAILNTFNKEKIQADVIYAHFWDCGIVAATISKEHNIPVFVATGESKIRVFDYYSGEKVFKAISRIKGVIAVSTKNLTESIKLGLINKDKTKSIVLPNGFNEKVFYKLIKENARKKLNLDLNNKIGIFVGAFNERKGIKRVLSACKDIDNLKLILIGAGEKISVNSNVLFHGTVPHDELVYYLNAADFFILPTLAEGCCNAIIEAMACGLPIISSNLPFNDDILNQNNSILIDPLNITEIRFSINKLLENPSFLLKLGESSLFMSRNLTITQRARNIVEFMKE